MSMTELLILNHYAGPEGGRHFQLARELVRRGHSVTIMASGFRHKANVVRREREVLAEGVKFRFVPTRPYRGNGPARIYNMLQYALGVGRHLPRGYRPDLVIGSSVHPFTWLAAERIAKRFDIPFIAEVRDLWPQTLIDMGAMKEDGFGARLFRGLEGRAYRRSQRIITLLPGADKYICARYGVEADKIVHISNGIDVEEFDRLAQEGAASAQRVLAPYGGKFLVAYAGAMGRANQLETIVQAAAEVLRLGGNDVQFLFFGQGPLEAKLKEQALELCLGNVHFMGYYSYTQIPALLLGCDLNIVAMQDIPLYQYGISLNKLFTYFASGKPVVFSGNVSNDLVREGGAGISVGPEDPAAIARAIMQLRADRIGAEEMGFKGRALVQERYTIPVLADKLMEVMEEVLV